MEELLVPSPGQVDAGFVRSLVLRGKKASDALWFRAGLGRKIVSTEAGTFMLDDRVQLKIRTSGGGSPVVRGVAGLKMDLIVPVKFRDGMATIEEEIQW